MELISNHLKYDFNCVQMVAYMPSAVIHESEQCVVGMNYHSDDEQYLSGEQQHLVDSIVVATLNVFTCETDTNWQFNIRKKGGPSHTGIAHSFLVCNGDIYIQPAGTYKNKVSCMLNSLHKHSHLLQVHKEIGNILYQVLTCMVCNLLTFLGSQYHMNM